MVNPILKYPGGKMRELAIIQNSLPEYTNYYEPFLGGGAVWLNVDAEHYFVNDLSVDLMNLYHFIQERNEDFGNTVLAIDNLLNLNEHEAFILQNSMLLTNYGDPNEYVVEITERLGRELDSFNAQQIFENKLRASFSRKQNKYSNMEFEDIVGLDDIAITVIKDSIYLTFREIYNGTNNVILKTALYWFLREFSYSSMFRFNSQGGFNVPYGGKSYNSKSLLSKLGQALSVGFTTKLDATVLANEDFQIFLRNNEPTENDFVFLDPPYDSEFSTYDQNTFDAAEQRRLADYLINELNGYFMLVIKETDFIAQLYPEGHETAGGEHLIHVNDFDKQYQVSFKNRNNKNTKHLMITNYNVQ